MIEEKDVEILENYILGNLSDDEVAVVKQRLIEEPELDAMLHDLKILMTAIRQDSRESLIQDMQVLESRIPDVVIEAQPVQHSRVRKLWAIGLAASLLLLVSILYFTRNAGGPNDELFATYFTPYPNVIAPASRGSNVPGQAIAFRYYDEQNYSGAINEFSKATSMDAVTHFYLGNSLLASGNPAGAAIHFEYCIKEGTFGKQASWYLALCYLKLGNNTNAIDLFEEISLDTTNHAADASRIVLQLKKE